MPRRHLSQRAVGLGHWAWQSALRVPGATWAWRQGKRAVLAWPPTRRAWRWVEEEVAVPWPWLRPAAPLALPEAPAAALPPPNPIRDLQAWARGGAERERETALAILRDPQDVAERFLAWRQGLGHRRVWLAGAHLAHLNLSGVDFRDCVLSQADLTGATLHGASFDGAQVDGTKHEGASFCASGGQALPQAFLQQRRTEGENWTVASLRHNPGYRSSAFQVRQSHVKVFRRKALRFPFEITSFLTMPCTLSLWVSDGIQSFRRGEVEVPAQGTLAWNLVVEPKEFAPSSRLYLVVHVKLDDAIYPVSRTRVAGWPVP